jgi:hypothetical protein
LKAISHHSFLSEAQIYYPTPCGLDPRKFLDDEIEFQRMQEDVESFLGIWKVAGIPLKKGHCGGLLSILVVGSILIVGSILVVPILIVISIVVAIILAQLLPHIRLCISVPQDTY